MEGNQDMSEQTFGNRLRVFLLIIKIGEVESLILYLFIYFIYLFVIFIIVALEIHFDIYQSTYNIS
jgi:hypothetical protein